MSSCSLVAANRLDGRNVLNMLSIVCYFLLPVDIIDFLQVHEGRNHEVRELVQNAGLQVGLFLSTCSYVVYCPFLDDILFCRISWLLFYLDLGLRWQHNVAFAFCFPLYCWDGNRRYLMTTLPSIVHISVTHDGLMVMGATHCYSLIYTNKPLPFIYS